MYEIEIEEFCLSYAVTRWKWRVRKDSETVGKSTWESNTEEDARMTAESYAKNHSNLKQAYRYNYESDELSE